MDNSTIVTVSWSLLGVIALGIVLAAIGVFLRRPKITVVGLDGNRIRSKRYQATSSIIWTTREGKRGTLEIPPEAAHIAKKNIWYFLDERTGQFRIPSVNPREPDQWTHIDHMAAGAFDIMGRIRRSSQDYSQVAKYALLALVVIGGLILAGLLISKVG